MKQIDNVIYPNFKQWERKEKIEFTMFPDDAVQDDIDAEIQAFFEADAIRRKQNAELHKLAEKYRAQGKEEEAMILFNKKQ